MPVTLQNTQNRMAAFNLEASELKLKRKVPRIHKLKDGTSRGLYKTIRLPDSVTFLAGEKKVGLPDQILECAEIKQALESKPPRLRLIAKAEPKPATKPNRASTASGRSGRR